LKEQHGGEAVALCAGPARAAQTIREALAKGTDWAIHIEEENPAALDPSSGGFVSIPLSKELRPGECIGYIKYSPDGTQEYVIPPREVSPPASVPGGGVALLRASIALNSRSSC